MCTTSPPTSAKRYTTDDIKKSTDKYIADHRKRVADKYAAEAPDTMSDVVSANQAWNEQKRAQDEASMAAAPVASAAVPEKSAPRGSLKISKTGEAPRTPSAQARTASISPRSSSSTSAAKKKRSKSGLKIPTTGGIGSNIPV